MFKYLTSVFIVTFLLIGISDYANCSLSKDSTSIIQCENYLLFKYRHTLTIAQDNNLFSPVFFDIRLPKGLLHMEIVNISSFGFYYKANQVVFILTDIYKKRMHLDTTFVPNNNTIDSLKATNFETSNDDRWNIKEIQIIKHRKNLMIVKNGTIILLFNIKRRNLEKYLDLVNSYVEISQIPSFQ
jgi:hypothetical protein